MGQVQSAATSERCDASLPERPYAAVHYHYGMLLGVDDFVADQAYHRGKMRLHAAWLHGAGVVWGLGVSADLERGEIRVAPGLAVDGAGRELHLDATQCLHVGRWFDAHRDDAGFAFTESGDGVTFDAHVVLRHRACLMQPVPAVLDTCAGTGTTTAYARSYETVELGLEPGRAPTAALPGRLLRVLLGEEAPRRDADGNLLPDDATALALRAEVVAAPAETRVATAARAWHRLAVLESLAAVAGPLDADVEADLFPAGAPVGIVLADVAGIALQRAGDGWTLGAAAADNAARAVLLSTAALQSGLCAVLAAAPSGSGAAAIGPRVARAERTGPTLNLVLDAPLEPGSVVTGAFRASRFAAGAWSEIGIDAAVVASDGLSVSVTLGADPGGSVFRFVALGTGAQPLLGTNRLPLAGDTASTPDGFSGAAHGRDFVWME